MMKYILLLLAFSTQVFASSSAINPTTVGNTYGFQGTGDTAYTPTLSAGFGTPTNVNFQYRRDGDQLIVHGTFTAGTVAASLGTISLPSGLSIDTTKLLAASTAGPCPAVGFYSTNDANQHGHILACTSTSTTIVYNSLNIVNDGHLTPNNANGSFTSSHVASITFTVPISGWSAGGAGGATLPRCQIEVYDSPGNASTNTNIKRFSNTKINSCSAGDATYADSSTAGGSFTINITGVYDATYCDYGSGATQHGISVDSTQLTTAYSSISASTQGNGINTAANTPACVTYHSSVTTVPQVWRAHNGNGGATGDNRIKFTLTKVSN